MDELNDGYLALWVAIECKCTVETAFKRLDSKNPKGVRPVITADDVEDMRAFRSSGMPFARIAKIYGTTDSSVFRRIAGAGA